MLPLYTIRGISIESIHLFPSISMDVVGKTLATTLAHLYFSLSYTVLYVSFRDVKQSHISYGMKGIKDEKNINKTKRKREKKHHNNGIKNRVIQFDE